MEAVLEGMAEYYSAELVQKIKRGIATKAEKCLYVGGSVPLGYKIDENKKFIIDMQIAPLIVRIFELYASGSTMKEINAFLNEQQIKTLRNGEFVKGSLNKMLGNRRYLGIYTYRGVEIPGGIPQIISDNPFERVQERLRENKKAPSRGKAIEEYLLTGKLYCGHCNSLMTGISGTSKTGKLHSYYSCYRARKKLCLKKNIQKETIENLIVNMAREQLTDENIQLIAKEVSTVFKEEKDSSNLKRLYTLLKENEKQKANLLDALKSGNASKAVINTIFDEIDKIEKANVEIQKAIAV